MVDVVLEALIGCAVLAACARIAACDVASRRIPNAWVAALLLLSAAQAIAAGTGLAVFDFLPAASVRIASFGLAAALVGGFELLWRRAHRGAHGMGMGDVKLIAAMAAWLGPACLAPLVGACASGIAGAAVGRERTFAFGPHLCAWFVAAFAAMGLL